MVILDEQERVKEEQNNFQRASPSDKKLVFKKVQNMLWYVYRCMMMYYSHPNSVIPLSQICVDWKDKELRKHGDFQKNIEAYKDDFKQLTDYQKVKNKLLELKSIMSKGNYIFYTEPLEQAIKIQYKQ